MGQPEETGGDSLSDSMWDSHGTGMARGMSLVKVEWVNRPRGLQAVLRGLALSPVPPAIPISGGGQYRQKV